MEDQVQYTKEQYIDALKTMPGLVSLVMIDNPYPYSPIIDGLDQMLLVILDDAVAATGHIALEGKRMLVRTVGQTELERSIASGEHRSLIQWLVRGGIVVDRDGYLERLRHKLLLFPDDLRQRKQLVEFAGFLRTYLQAKQDLQDKNVLDAYSHVLNALHHWAHIVLIEAGHHPELTVWRQMRRFHPGIYKLFEELTASPESLEQRVKLVLLACEFSVMSKMKSSCSLLFHILSSRKEPWSISELQQHPAISGLHVDLSLVVQQLVKRSYVREVAIMPAEGDPDALELRYRLAESMA
ncbi:nucleotidyltransferase-like protein [Paenibacillus cisolokensis]|uniref:Nucleotidyltransferase-like domain-containing protein n=1 Tax=Paenibacillus cisolokensis TaxID=1658519 RepID=A0ABQ4N2Y5_9BACL|nr:nucleotidyltransferase-like protein [Paenibacillus cisolokensis]GIQ62524.1 hypothetical protein PACILC2_10920 [Paenibacillus cisolokensis]